MAVRNTNAASRIAVLLALLVALSACGSATKAPLDAAAPRLLPPSGGVAKRAVPAAPVQGPAGFPALSELPRGGSAAPGDRQLDGSEYDSGLPSARVFPAAPNLSFAPAGSDWSELSYAIYHFDLPGYGGGGSVETSWDTLPAAADLYLGLADYAKGAWQWFNGDPAAVISLPGSLDFLSPGDQVYIAVVMLGTSVHALQEISFGGDLAPVAAFWADKTFADTGATINFDASASTDDLGITKYEWDLDGNGSFETDTGTTPAASKSYAGATTLTVKLRVTDGSTQTSEAATQIVIDSNGYDETEPNNSVGTADPLPGPGFSGWEGNLGPGGYDGGSEDYYRITTAVPVRMEYRFDSLFLNGNFSLKLLDATGVNVIVDGGFMTGTATLRCFLDTPGDYILVCSTPEGANTDYYLSGTADFSTGYDEVEPNNSFDTANALDPAGVSNFWGNLGAGGYDGGAQDWYSLDVAQANTYYTLSAGHNFLQLGLELRLYDTDGVTELAMGYFDNGQAKLGYGFTSSGTYYIELRAASGGGAGNAGDYLLDLVNNGAMPEVVLDASPDNGVRPLNVLFNATGSSIPEGAPVAAYQWDLNGDGWYEQETPDSVPTAGCTYYRGGTFTPRLRILLATGAAGVGTATVDVSGAPSEVEPNQDYDFAQVLPSFPVSDFYGDVGQTGYDGGYNDFYKFDLADGEAVQFDLQSQQWFAPLGCALVDFDGLNETVLDSSVSNSGLDQVSCVNASGMTKSFYFVVYTDPTWPGDSGYKMDAFIF